MKARALALLAVTACSKQSDPAPQPPKPEPAASVVAPASASPKAVAAPASVFSIIARAPTSDSCAYDDPSDTFAMPMPLVQRLPNGGLVVAAAYARAKADGAGPLEVELIGKGLEWNLFHDAFIVAGAEGFRWISTDLLTKEEEVSRSGPRVTSYKLENGAFKRTAGNTGYWGATKRQDTVLALEHTAYEVPNSSIYPKGSEFYANGWDWKPTHVAVLSGKGVAPQIPAGVCPTAMAAADDGTLIVSVDKCGKDVTTKERGVLRYAPGASTSKVEWFDKRGDGPTDRPDWVTMLAVNANEIYVAEGTELRTWDGKAWTTSAPFGDKRIGSISRSPKGELWAITRGSSVMKRENDTWSKVALPNAPSDPLDAHPFEAPGSTQDAYVPVDKLGEQQRLRDDTEANMIPYRVDAAGDDVLVSAIVGHEVFVLSTKARTPVARIPSIPTQRAQLASTLPHPAPTSKDRICNGLFLAFPASTTLAAVKEAGGDAATEATVEGQKRVVIFGQVTKDYDGIEKKLAKLSPTRMCGWPVLVKAP